MKPSDQGADIIVSPYIYMKPELEMPKNTECRFVKSIKNIKKIIISPDCQPYNNIIYSDLHKIHTFQLVIKEKIRAFKKWLR